MQSSAVFISDLVQLKEQILSILAVENNSEVLLSGMFDNFSLKEILDSVLSSKNTSNYKIIIPYILGRGIMSRAYINKVCMSKNELRINSRFKPNLLVIGNHAFILSFSYRYNKQCGMKMFFECCVMTDDSTAVEDIKKVFQSAWDEGFSLSKD